MLQALVEVVIWSSEYRKVIPDFPRLADAPLICGSPKVSKIAMAKDAARISGRRILYYMNAAGASSVNRFWSSSVPFRHLYNMRWGNLRYRKLFRSSLKGCRGSYSVHGRNRWNSDPYVLRSTTFIPTILGGVRDSDALGRGWRCHWINLSTPLHT